MTRAELKQLAKKNLEGKWGLAIGAMLIYVILSSGISAVTSFGNPQMGVLFFSNIISVLLLPLLVGYSKIHLDFASGDSEINQLFSGYQGGRFVENIATLFVMGLFTFFWTLLFIIPGIVKAYAYAMTPYILADERYAKISPLDAITKSRELMDGKKMDLFILGLSFLGWIILSMMTFGILLLYVGPYIQQTTAQFYLEVSGGTPKVTATPEALNTKQVDDSFYE